MIFRYLFLLIGFTGICNLANASNFRFEKVEWLTNKQVVLTIAWDNSWNLEGTAIAPQNHDAVYLFGKYKDAYGKI
jgi:hypothetical protein